MAHWKPTIKVSASGIEVRLRRDRAAAPTRLTNERFSYHMSDPPKPHPKGGVGWQRWLADTFSGYLGRKGERKRRKDRARMKVYERRQARRRHNYQPLWCDDE